MKAETLRVLRRFSRMAAKEQPEWVAKEWTVQIGDKGEWLVGMSDDDGDFVAILRTSNKHIAQHVAELHNQNRTRTKP